MSLSSAGIVHGLEPAIAALSAKRPCDRGVQLLIAQTPMPSCVGQHHLLYRDMATMARCSEQSEIALRPDHCLVTASWPTSFGEPYTRLSPNTTEMGPFSTLAKEGEDWNTPSRDLRILIKLEQHSTAWSAYQDRHTEELQLHEKNLPPGSMALPSSSLIRGSGDRMTVERHGPTTSEGEFGTTPFCQIIRMSAVAASLPFSIIGCNLQLSPGSGEESVCYARTQDLTWLTPVTQSHTF